MRSLTLVLVAVALFAHVALAQFIQEESFESIKGTPREQLVVFYHSSHPDTERVLTVVQNVASKFSIEHPTFGYKKVDGELEVNRKDFADASFSQEPYIFTSTPEVGIEKYPHDMNKNTLLQHLRNIYLPFDAANVKQFEGEDALYEMIDSNEPPRPVFIKFYEEWCAHCKALKRPFMIAATKHLGKVDYMEVQCSKNEETQQFCKKNGVTGYPGLILFTGEQKHEFKKPTRSLISMEEFFKEVGVFRDENSSTPSANDDDGILVEVGGNTENVATGVKNTAAVHSTSSETKPDPPPPTNTKATTGSSTNNNSSNGGGSLTQRVAKLEELVKKLQGQLANLESKI